MVGASEGDNKVQTAKKEFQHMWLIDLSFSSLQVGHVCGNLFLLH